MGNIIKKILRKVNDILLEIFFNLKLSVVPILPTKIDVEPINFCNLKCKYCQSTYWSKESKKLSIEQFSTLIKQFTNLKYVKLQGIGEPMLNEEISEMINLCKSRNIATEIISNGMILPRNIKDSIRKMDKVNIQFSIDGPKHIMQEVRVGSDNARIIENIKTVMEERNTSKYPVVSIWSVVTSHNIDDLKYLIDLTKELSVDYISFQIFLNDWYDDNVRKYSKANRIDFHSGEYLGKINSIRKYADEKEVNLNIYSGNYLSKRNKCQWPFKSAFIAANGDVVPCCVLSNSDIIRMGNVFEEDFSKIWNNKLYQDFRRRIRKHNIYEFCKPCYNELQD